MKRTANVWAGGGAIPRQGKRDVIEDFVVEALVKAYPDIQIIKMSNRGVPDLLVTIFSPYHGQFVTGFIEVKSGTRNTLTEDQERFMDWYRGLKDIAYTPEQAVVIVGGW